MYFTIRFKIGKRYAKGLRFTLSEFCTHVIERYGLTETEITKIVTLQVGESTTNEVLQIKRIA